MVRLPSIRTDNGISLSQRAFPELRQIPADKSYVVCFLDGAPHTIAGLILSAYITGCAHLGKWAVIAREDIVSMAVNLSQALQCSFTPEFISQEMEFLENRELIYLYTHGFVYIDHRFVRDAFEAGEFTFL